MINRILKICQRHCGHDITEDTDLIHSKRLESCQLMEIIIDLEDEFGFELEPEEIGNVQNFETVNAISSLIEIKL